jgi:DNA-binding NarL/FixJ family response regulator
MAAVLLEPIIRVVVVDGNLLRRGALRFILEHLPNLNVLGEAGDGYEAIEMVVDFNPDIVLMDMSLPVLDGVEATRIISSQFPETRVIVLAMHNDPAHSDIALQAGACQFLAKDCGKDRLLEAIRGCSTGPFAVAGRLSD